MKKILLLVLSLLMLGSGFAQPKSFVNQGKKYSVNIIDPLTVADQYWAAKHEGTIQCFQDLAKTVTAVDGEGVQCVDNLVGSSDLDFDGDIVGPAQIQSDFDYGDTAPYPKFHNKGGGFIQIINSTPQRFQSAPNMTGVTAASQMWLIRMTGGTDNEYFIFITNGLGFRDRDAGTGNSTQLGYSSGSGNLGSALRVLQEQIYQLVAIEVHRDASGNAQMYVNGVAYGSPVAIGTNNLTEFAFGSNAHNATLSFYAGAMINGARDENKTNSIIDYWESAYGAMGSYPTDFPYITFDDAGYDDFETWSTGDKSINAPSYTFRNGTEGATEFRLYGSTSSAQATAIGTKFLVATKIRGVDANPGKFIRGTDYGVAPGTQTNVYYWIEVIGVDDLGNRQPFATNGGGILDNQASNYKVVKMYNLLNMAA